MAGSTVVIVAELVWPAGYQCSGYLHSEHQKLIQCWCNIRPASVSNKGGLSWQVGLIRVAPLHVGSNKGDLP